MPELIDLRPRIVLHTVAGDMVLDPLDPQAAPVPAWASHIITGYDVTFSQPELAPGTSVGDTLSRYGLLLGLVVAGAVLLARRVR